MSEMTGGNLAAETGSFTDRDTGKDCGKGAGVPGHRERALDSQRSVLGPWRCRTLGMSH